MVQEKQNSKLTNRSQWIKLHGRLVVYVHGEEIPLADFVQNLPPGGKLTFLSGEETRNLPPERLRRRNAHLPKGMQPSPRLMVDDEK